jgi:hypothetical protein
LRSLMGGGILPPSMLTGHHSEVKKPEPQDCPKCGKLLVSHASRVALDGDGNPELVLVYFCFTDGFYTFRPRTGLTHDF